MADYKKLYYIMFRANCRAMEILHEATLRTEELYMDSKDPIALEDVLRTPTEEEVEEDENCPE